MRRVVGLLSALSISAIALPGAVCGVIAAHAAPHIPELGKVNVLRANRTAWTRIHISQPVQIQKMKIEISGDGRAAGLMLVSAGVGPHGEPQTMDAIQSGQCEGRACSPRTHPIPPWLRDNGFNGTIDPGVYQVYVIADDAPVTVRWKVPGLKGALHKSLQWSARIKFVDAPTGVDGNGNVYSAGYLMDEPHDFAFFSLWVGGKPNALQGWGDCSYYPGDHPQPPAAFMPGCQGTGRGETGTWGWGTYASHHNTLEEDVEDFRAIGVGGWMSDAATVDVFGASGFWLDFAPWQG